MEIEHHLLQKLKLGCGLNQVDKISQMFKDVLYSKELQSDFRIFRSKNEVSNISFEPEVL